LGVLAMVSVLLLGALGTRIWFLQGVQQGEYQARVTAAKTRTVYIPPERGRIFDAKGRIVADNQRILTVTVDWAVVRNKPKARAALFERLSGPLKVPVAELEARYNSGLYSQLLPLPLKEDVSEDIVTFLQERSEDYPGIDVTEGWRRVYPFAPLASHVVGYLGAITKETLESYQAAGYNRNERVGQFGVELSLESTLHGSWGRRVFEIDAAGNIVRELDDQFIAPVAGKDVQLSIDLDLQQYAEQALETQLMARRNLPEEMRAHNPLDPKTKFTTRVFASSKQYGETEWIPYKAPAGAVVILDHHNGQVLAMASYPTFDNRWQGAGISGEKYNQLFPSKNPDGTKIDPDQSILVNRAVQGRYNLGSTIKPFIAWSALHSGIIDANYEFLDEGTYTLTSIERDRCQEYGGTAKCIFKNATGPYGKPSQYGPVKVEDALAVSSDAFFYRIGELFYSTPGLRDELKADLERFGFGADSGIQLPFEWDGRIPDDAVKKELVEKGVLGKNEVGRLVVGDSVQVAIGQGLMAATPLQIANAYATLANGGFLLQPNIVKAIYTPLTPDAGPAEADLAAGVVDQSFERPIVRDELEMPPQVRDPLVKGLQRVILGEGTYYPKGYYHTTTGEVLFRTYAYSALPIAGKTGTAQGAGNYPWNDSSVFGAFSLDDAQPYTVVAYLEKSGYGSKAAAPVVKCIFSALAGRIRLDPVLPSDQLDVNSTIAAPPKSLADPSCLGGVDNTVKD
jgi:penicillin-binding protein 2